MTNLKPLILGAALALMAAPALAGDGGKSEAMKAARATALAEADTNGDGALNPEEFQAYTQAMKKQRAQLRFARMDANGDGQISAEELENGRPHRGDCKH